MNDQRNNSAGAKESSNHSASWNADALAQRTSGSNNWDPAESKKKTTNHRLQDISVGLNSSHHQKQQQQQHQMNYKKETWPFESSPCRMYGGKNTKKGGEAMNKELFNSDFADNSVNLSDAESFCADEEETGHDLEQRRKSPPKSVRKSRSSGTTRTKESESSRTGGSYKTSSSRRAPRRHSTSSHEHPDHRPHPTTSSKHKDSSQQLSATTHGSSYNKLLSWNRKGKQDADESETNPSTEEQTIAFPRRASIRRDKDENASHESIGSSHSSMGSRSSLGSGSGRARRSSVERRSSLERRSTTKRAEQNEENAPTRGVDSRATRRSSLSKRGSSSSSSHHNNNDLSAATCHGTADGYSRRSSRSSRNGPSRTKSGDSMEVRGRSSRGDELGAATLHGKSSISRIREKRRTSLSGGTSHTSSSNTTSKSSSSSSRKADRRANMKRGMSTTNVRGPEEYHGANRGAVSGLGPELENRPRRGSRRPKPEPRDLITLFREKKEVTHRDLADKDNRQIFHCLMLEHRLNVSLEELSKTVRKESKHGLIVERPKPELYVEA